MKITKSKLEEFARTFIGVLDDKKVDSVEDLDGILNEQIFINNTDFVFAEIRPSNSGTEAYTLSYIRPDIGIPIEAKINLELGYSKIILKFDGELTDYSIFSQDPYGNLVQSKDLGGADFGLVREELRRLSG